METKVNFAAVGAFVLLLGAAFVAAVLWLSAGGSSSKKQYDLYLAVVNESVSGLNVNAPVKYLGVDVGRVRDIRLDPVNPQEVKLTFAIERGTPIKRDTEAVLRTQGLTGIAYVELSGGTLTEPPLQGGADGSLPVIRTKPSLAARLENVMTAVLTNVDRTAANINALLNDENRDAVKSVLADTAQLTRALASQNAIIASTLVNADRTARNTARATEKLGPLIERVSRSAAAVDQIAVSAVRMTGSAEQTINAIGGSVRHVSDETLPEIDRLLAEIGTLTHSLRRLSEQTERSPSSLLRGRVANAPGPGEKARP